MAVAEAEAGPGQAAKRKRQARGARREQRRTGVSAQEHGINTRRLACKNPASRQMWLDPHSDKSELENCQKIADSYQPSSLARRTTPSRPPSRSSPKRNNLYWYFVPTARAAQTWWISARMEARRLVYHLGCRRHHNHYPRYRMHRIISCLMPHASSLLDTHSLCTFPSRPRNARTANFLPSLHVHFHFPFHHYHHHHIFNPLVAHPTLSRSSRNTC